MEDSSEIDKLFSDCMITNKNCHKKYTVEYKLKVLKLLELNVSIHSISDKLGIDRKIIREWREKKNSLLKVENKENSFRCNRTIGLHTFFTESEEIEIIKWIAEMRSKGYAVSTKSLICFAGKINPKFKEKKLHQQLNWAYRFLKRKGFSIRRVSHIGQKVPKERNIIKSKFITEIINLRKDMSILYEDNFRILNMDETACFLDMTNNTTIDYKGNKNIELLTTGKEKYRISIILAITGDGFKLPPMLILKGEQGKTVEKNLRKLSYVINGDIFIHCQKEGWCTTDIFECWIKEIFLPYQKMVCEKCLLTLDNASAHNSNNALDILKSYDIKYAFIPPGMTPECQPLDISVNKIFKDNIKQKFEENRLFFDNINPKIKLNQCRLNLIDYIHQVWYDNSIITKNCIINGFIQAGLINKYYLSKDEENIQNSYLYYLIDLNKNEIIDDLGDEINISDNEFEDFNQTEEKVLPKNNLKINNVGLDDLDEYEKNFKEKNNDINLDNKDVGLDDIDEEAYEDNKNLQKKNNDIKLDNNDVIGYNKILNFNESNHIKEYLSNLEFTFSKETNSNMEIEYNKLYNNNKMDLDE